VRSALAAVHATKALFLRKKPRLAAIFCCGAWVRKWHLADIQLAPAMSAFGT
jgi:hypothetical protein